jgi:tRNA (mo5U34)-methyltransferase
MHINYEIEEEILCRQWFYRFRLPSGRTTESYLTEEVLRIHDCRKQMLIETLEAEFGNSWRHVSCLDLACHEGYFAHALAERGCKEVLGIDARSEHVAHANLMRTAFGQTNLRFAEGDIQRLTASEFGRFDATVLFGILYHLENVVGVLRLAQAVTARVCLIETQIAPNLSGVTDWGSYKSVKEIVGCLAIVDETTELAGHNREASLTAISLVPSLPGLMWLLKAVGFQSSKVITPPADAYEQLASGKRVVVAAYNS